MNGSFSGAFLGPSRTMSKNTSKQNCCALCIPKNRHSGTQRRSCSTGHRLSATSNTFERVLIDLTDCMGDPRNPSANDGSRFFNSVQTLSILGKPQKLFFLIRSILRTLASPEYPDVQNDNEAQPELQLLCNQWPKRSRKDEQRRATAQDCRESDLLKRNSRD